MFLTNLTFDLVILIEKLHVNLILSRFGKISEIVDPGEFTHRTLFWRKLHVTKPWPGMEVECNYNCCLRNFSHIFRNFSFFEWYKLFEEPNWKSLADRDWNEVPGFRAELVKLNMFSSVFDTVEMFFFLSMVWLPQGEITKDYEAWNGLTHQTLNYSIAIFFDSRVTRNLAMGLGL